jgi:tetratricopeptide (TPR) repeat protein
LGQIDQQLGLFEESLGHFTKVRQLDHTFCADIVNLRIAEVHYKLDQVEESLQAIELSEQAIKTKDLYMVHLLKGKCYDKCRQYEMAIEHYTQALKMAKK